MRLALLFAVALIGGIAVGTYNASSEFHAVVQHFGPYSEEENFDSSKIGELLSRTEAQGFSKLEVIGDKQFDFGVMHRDEEGEYTFEIRNVGEEMLNLKVTSSTCKCTVGELDAEWYEPGQIAQVKMKWKTKSKGTVFSQTATVTTNDPSNAEVKLVITGKLVDSILLEPRTWSKGIVPSGSDIDLELTAYNYNEGKVKIKDAEFVEPHVQELSEIKWVERVPSKDVDDVHRRALQAFDFTVKVRPGLKQGSLNHLFRVNFDGVDSEPKFKFFETRLIGEIVGPMQIIAGSRLDKTKDGGGYALNIGKVTEGEGKIDRVHLVLRGADYKDLEVEIAEVNPSDVFEVELGEEIVRKTLKTIPVQIVVKKDAPIVKMDGNNPEDYGWVLLKPVDSTLSPLKLWLTIEIAKPK